jgi:ABC-type lipoprotein export system ATPase subunit
MNRIRDEKMTNDLLTLKAVSFEHEECLLLSGITLSFLRGKVYIITSEPDGGKSLLLKIAGGILKPTEGEVEFRGVDLYHEKHGKDLTKRIGSVFQESTLISNLSVEENILLPIKYLDPGYNYEAVILEVINLFRYFQINIRNLGKRPSDVSYSVKKLINIIRVIVTKPEIFLIDAPFFNLNAVDRKQLFLKLLEMKKKGETMVIATNDRKLIEDLGDEVILLAKGQIKENCRTADFFRSSNPAVINFIDHQVGG